MEKKMNMIMLLITLFTITPLSYAKEYNDKLMSNINIYENNMLNQDALYNLHQKVIVNLNIDNQYFIEPLNSSVNNLPVNSNAINYDEELPLENSGNILLDKN